MVSPAEGYLHMESVWTMGPWLGLVAFYYLGTGVPVGMQKKFFTLFLYLPLLPLFFVVPASVRL